MSRRKSCARCASTALMERPWKTTEVATVEQLLLSGKKPPSLSKFMSTSLRFRQRFKEEQQAECLQVLEHMGWAPQRFTSQALSLWGPWLGLPPQSTPGRISLRLAPTWFFFTVVAEEAEGFRLRNRSSRDSILKSCCLILTGLCSVMMDSYFPDPKWTNKESQQGGGVVRTNQCPSWLIYPPEI